MQTLMREWGHDIDTLSRNIVETAKDGSVNAVAPGYVRALIDRIESSTILHDLFATLSRYGRSGRFHHLDIFGELARLLFRWPALVGWGTVLSENTPMSTAAILDVEAIRRPCEKHRVRRLRVFGSVLTDRFDPEHSDVDFLVDFLPGNDNLFHDYFDLKDELERILGREVDLVDASAVRNPYFKASAFGTAQDLNAA